MTTMTEGKQTPPRAKVAVIHPGLGFGGSEAAVLWTIEALKAEYDVTLISMGDVDLERLNAYYGTSLATGDFSTRRVPLPWGFRNTSKFSGLKGRFLQRYVRRVAPEFDVLISGYGPMDFGKPGVQIIADFSFVEDWRLELHPTFRTRKTWFYGDTLVRRTYLGICERIAPVHPEAWKQNITLANSSWSAARLLKKYGILSQVVYPPVSVDFPSTPSRDRDKGFVCLGRVSPEKCVHSVIAILQKVRERGHDVHLHILGGLDDSDYANQVRSLAERCREWVFLEGITLGDRKRELLAGHRFGINACPNEAFGIAVAEMVLAGCVVFVPNGGGQVEIINHPALIYQNDADAVEKIAAVLTHETEEEALRTYLRAGSKTFSVETFVGAVRRTIVELLQPRAQPH
jgi:glycosyltransferase involved in cell wall biosynthesis